MIPYYGIKWISSNNIYHFFMTGIWNPLKYDIHLSIPNHEMTSMFRWCQVDDIPTPSERPATGPSWYTWALATQTIQPFHAGVRNMLQVYPGDLN